MLLVVLNCYMVFDNQNLAHFIFTVKWTKHDARWINEYFKDSIHQRDEKNKGKLPSEYCITSILWLELCDFIVVRLALISKPHDMNI